MALVLGMRSAPFEITLPASSANLGPGFDCAALALRLFLRVRARVAHGFTVVARGRDAALCSDLNNNLLIATYATVLSKESRAPVPLALEIENEIPIGKGLGSSAAARLAGICLAVHFGDLRWGPLDILQAAAWHEGHADNAAACWLGGLTLAQTANGKVNAVKLRSWRWSLLLAVPPQPLNTDDARAVLPATLSRADAVANVQSAMLLVAAFAEHRVDWLAPALVDRLHQPYRQTLCPLLPPLRALAGRGGIVGAVLSGAGPSVLMVLTDSAQPARVKEEVSHHLRQHGLEAELLFTAAENRGADQRRRNGRNSAAGETR